MKGYPYPETIQWRTYTAAANTQVAATYTPASDECISIDSVVASYSGGTPASATLIISDGTNAMTCDMNVVGPIEFLNSIPFIGLKGAVVSVLLAAAGVGVIGRLNVGRRF